MPSWVERIAARFAFLHARRVYGRFQRALRDVQASQRQALRSALTVVQGSDFARRYSLASVHTLDDLRKAVPLLTYEDTRPYVDRLRDGDTTALLSPRQRVLMFATSSGTTAQPKYIPVTVPFAHDYRRGWNTFGLKLLVDHPQAVLRPILQCSGRHDERRTPKGVPCGAITGLMARTQKRIVRRFYVGRPEIAEIADARARYYTLMRFGVVRDVAFAVTANPATLIRLAAVANEESETLLRDVRDGSLDRGIVDEEPLRRRLEAGLRPEPQRARELAALRKRCGRLRPADYWKLEFVACWTGGSMSHFLDPLADWYGRVPVRDVGLLASEGRVTIPLEDNSPTGVLDVSAACFEFISGESAEQLQPQTLSATELETGCDYAVVLTNTAGLIRYRLDDVVRVRGWVGQVPVLEFLHRAGRVSSVVGEKLTENQVAAAVQKACHELGIGALDFVVAPQWADPPFYRMNCTPCDAQALSRAVDAALCEQNDEYRSRRKSGRLGCLCVRTLDRTCLAALDTTLMVSRGGSPEQYKRPGLLTGLGEDDTLLACTRQI